MNHKNINQSNKDFVHNDEAHPEVADRVRASFRGLGYQQLNLIDCEVREGTAHLNGTISSFYLKQVAQAIAAKTPGVHQVVNKISVQ